MVDHFALVLGAVFVAAGYVVVLLSTNYIAEGDYAEGEYYFLLLCSILGMTVMASARDLITIFVALELLSIPPPTCWPPSASATCAATRPA